MQTLLGHSGYVYSVCFSFDGWRLANTGKDETEKIWDGEESTWGHAVAEPPYFLKSIDEKTNDEEVLK